MEQRTEDIGDDLVERPLPAKEPFPFVCRFPVQFFLPEDATSADIMAAQVLAAKANAYDAFSNGGNSIEQGLEWVSGAIQKIRTAVRDAKNAIVAGLWGSNEQAAPIPINDQKGLR